MPKPITRGHRKLQLLEKLESDPGYVLDAYRQAFQVEFLPSKVRANPRLVEEILATLASRFHLELVPGHAVVPEALVTLRPKSGVHVWARELS